MKKILSSFLVFCILVSSCCINVSASYHEIKEYDGMLYSGDITTEQLDALPEQYKAEYRIDGSIIESIQTDIGYMQPSETTDISSRGVIPSNQISSSLVVSTNSERNQFRFLMYVKWLGAALPAMTLKDKIAISWSDEFTLEMSNAGIRPRGELGFSTDRVLLAEVEPEKGLAYELDTTAGDEEFSISCWVTRPPYSGTANVVGGFAHTILGGTPSVSFGSTGASVGFSGGLQYETMQPVYKAINY